MRASRLAELLVIAAVGGSLGFALSVLSKQEPKQDRCKRDHQVLEEPLSSAQCPLNPESKPALVLDGMPAERVDLAPPTHGVCP